MEKGVEKISSHTLLSSCSINPEFDRSVFTQRFIIMYEFLGVHVFCSAATSHTPLIL